MNTTPVISVIIPTYNHAQYLKKALNSLCIQTFPNWEAVVINNYSQDDTIEVVKSFNDSRIRIKNFKNNGIIAASRNLAINITKGKYLAFLDSDDTWLPEKLAICKVILDEGHDLVCHGLHLFGNKSEKDQYYGPSNRATYKALLYKGNCIATSATMVRRDLVENVGGFSENKKFVTAEDYHLWIKLAQIGTKIVFIDHILGNYRFHESNTGTTIKQATAVKYVVEDFFPNQKARSILDKIRIRFRYGIIDYGIARSMQSQGKYSIALYYLFKSLHIYPLFIKIYVAIAINIILLIFSILFKKEYIRKK